MIHVVLAAASAALVVKPHILLLALDATVDISIHPSDAASYVYRELPQIHE
jgi:hypothetical protein